MTLEVRVSFWMYFEEALLTETVSITPHTLQISKAHPTFRAVDDQVLVGVAKLRQSLLQDVSLDAIEALSEKALLHASI